MSSKVVSYRPKVFQIGFNKCGTTSLYHLFKKSGYRAVHGGGRHWRETGHPAFQNCNIHRIVRGNIDAGRPPVEGFEAFDAFFDMEQTGRSELIHNYLRFEAFAEAYPDAKFIFNYRDVNAWIRSRLNHGRGSYFYRMSRYYDTDADGLAEIWRHQFEEHKARVETYFRDKPHRLFVFRLEEAPVEALCAFLRPAYRLKPKRWEKTRVGSATQVHAAE